MGLVQPTVNVISNWEDQILHDNGRVRKPSIQGGKDTKAQKCHVRMRYDFVFQTARHDTLSLFLSLSVCVWLALWFSFHSMLLGIYRPDEIRALVKEMPHAQCLWKNDGTSKNLVVQRHNLDITNRSSFLLILDATLINLDIFARKMSCLSFLDNTSPMFWGPVWAQGLEPKKIFLEFFQMQWTYT